MATCDSPAAASSSSSSPPRSRTRPRRSNTCTSTTPKSASDDGIRPAGFGGGRSTAARDARKVSHEDLDALRGKRGILGLVVRHIEEHRGSAPRRRSHRPGGGCRPLWSRALGGGGGHVLARSAPLDEPVPPRGGAVPASVPKGEAPRQGPSEADRRHPAWRRAR